MANFVVVQSNKLIGTIPILHYITFNFTLKEKQTQHFFSVWAETYFSEIHFLFFQISCLFCGLQTNIREILIITVFSQYHIHDDVDISHRRNGKYYVQLQTTIMVSDDTIRSNVIISSPYYNIILVS